MKKFQVEPRSRTLISDPVLATRMNAVYELPTSEMPENVLLGRVPMRDRAIFLRDFNIRFIAGDPYLIEWLFAPEMRQRIDGQCGMAFYRVDVETSE